jgi:hypothetical protein
MAGLCLGSGTLVRLVEFGLNPAFAMLFLPSQDLVHQGSLACLVLYARILAWFPAGAARRLFWLTHGQILLQPGDFGSAPRQIHRLARPPAALMPGDIASHQQQWHTIHGMSASRDLACRMAAWRRCLLLMHCACR